MQAWPPSECHWVHVFTAPSTSSYAASFEKVCSAVPDISLQEVTPQTHSCLMATASPLRVSSPLNTCPKAPRPSSSPSMYLSVSAARPLPGVAPPFAAAPSDALRPRPLADRMAASSPPPAPLAVLLLWVTPLVAPFAPPAAALPMPLGRGALGGAAAANCASAGAAAGMAAGVSAMCAGCRRGWQHGAAAVRRLLSAELCPVSRLQRTLLRHAAAHGTPAPLWHLCTHGG